MELKVLRATGETSRTTTSQGNLELQEDWVALRLLEQQSEVGINVFFIRRLSFVFGTEFMGLFGCCFFFWGGGGKGVGSLTL